VTLPAARLIVLDQIPADHPQKKVLPDYATRYQAEFKTPAGHFGGHAWDAAKLVVKGLRESSPDAAKIRDGIEQTTSFVGTDGIFNYSPQEHNGLSKDAFVMVEIANGKWKLVQ